jgi:hypothetical protein
VTARNDSLESLPLWAQNHIRAMQNELVRLSEENQQLKAAAARRAIADAGLTTPRDDEDLFMGNEDSS